MDRKLQNNRNNEPEPTRSNTCYFCGEEMKRRSNRVCDQPAKQAKHKIEYDVRWKEAFP